MSFRDVLGRVGPWPRRAAALVCLLLAAVTALDGTAGKASPTAGPRAVVVAQALPAGHVLGAGDLRIARVAPVVPGTTTSPRSLVGRVLAGPLARGEPVTRLRLIGPQLTSALTDGSVAMPLTVADDVRGLVSPGGRVDVLSTASPDAVEGATSPRRVASGVLVLAVSALPGGERTRLVLALGRDAALRIAGDQSVRVFRVSAVSP